MATYWVTMLLYDVTITTAVHTLRQIAFFGISRNSLVFTTTLIHQASRKQHIKAQINPWAKEIT